MNKGLIYLFTGNGKGKTSAALGVGVRAALSGMKVGMVCWYKEEKWRISEASISKRLPNFKVFLMGEGFYKLPTDHASGKEHKEASRKALEKARKLLGKVDLLILDEVNNAVKDKLINLDDLIDLVSKRGKTHLILTGRGAYKEIIGMADLVTDMHKVKHPFDKGLKAVKGLDY